MDHPYRDPRDRYRTDAEFSALVNMIRGWIHRLHWTPSEIREAAMLACVLEEMEHTRTRILDGEWLRRLASDVEASERQRR